MVQGARVTRDDGHGEKVSFFFNLTDSDGQACVMTFYLISSAFVYFNLWTGEVY